MPNGPDGGLVGQEGDSYYAREMSGGIDEAQNTFETLSQGGINYKPDFTEGSIYQMPDGSFITYRPISGSGPPTIDVNLPGSPRIIKLKFK